jgi:hypothetical protein
MTFKTLDGFKYNKGFLREDPLFVINSIGSLRDKMINKKNMNFYLQICFITVKKMMVIK